MGKVDLKSWNDLWFFNYSNFNPAHDVSMTESVSNVKVSNVTKISNTIKSHVTFGHASGRRVHGAFKHASRGDEIFSDLKCTCQICAVTKSETPGHRKLERYFQHVDIDESKITGEYLIAHDPRIQEAINILRDMDTCAQPPLTATVSTTLPMSRKGIVADLHRSTVPRQYWHADTIPLAPNWQKAKHVYMDAATDPMCPSFPDSHVIMDSGEQ